MGAGAGAGTGPGRISSSYCPAFLTVTAIAAISIIQGKITSKLNASIAAGLEKSRVLLAIRTPWQSEGMKKALFFDLKALFWKIGEKASAEVNKHANAMARNFVMLLERSREVKFRAMPIIPM